MEKTNSNNNKPRVRGKNNNKNVTEKVDDNSRKLWDLPKNNAFVTKRNKGNKNKEKRQSANCHYASLLSEPFISEPSKLPKYYMGDTFCFKRVVNYSLLLSANASGNCFVMLEPECFGDNTINLTPLLVDNTPTYSPTTGQTVSTSPVALSASLNLNLLNIENIRLVSAGAKFWVTDSALNLKGSMYATSVANPAYTLNFGSGVGAAVDSPQNKMTLTYLVKTPNHVETALVPEASIEYRWLPASIASFDSPHLALYQASKLGTIPVQMERCVVIIVGAPTTATLNIQMVYHFEVTVDSNGEYAEFTSRGNCLTDPFEVITGLAQDKSIQLKVIKQSESLGHAHATSAVAANIPIDQKEIASMTNQLGGRMFQYKANGKTYASY